MSDFEITAAAPFRKNVHKSEFAPMELVFFYALDKKWMDKDEAKAFIEAAVRKGYLKRTPAGNFLLDESLAEMNVPIGFRPDDSIFKISADPFDELLEKISGASGQSKKDLAKEMQGIIDKFDGHLFPEAAVILLAKKYHVEYSEYHSDLAERIRG